MKSWKIEYKNHNVEVKNGISGEQLFIDGELQDERIGPAGRSRLYGRIKRGNGEGEQIKISIGGWFRIDCRIFIDDTLVLPQK